MIIILIVLLAVAVLVALYYRSKAIEFESLFELSKGYELPEQTNANILANMRADAWRYGIDSRGMQWSTNVEVDKNGHLRPIKYNKDGSIAKKRGPKPKGAKA